MTDHRFDLGRRAGPDFVPPPLIPTTRSGTGVAVPPAPPQDREPPARSRSTRRAAILVTACLLCGGVAGAGTGFLAAHPAVRSTIPQHQPDARGLGQMPDAQTAAGALLPSVVQVSAGNNSGSGFAIDSDSHIMTNSHVVQGFSRIVVRMSDGRTTAARVVGTDPSTDVAVLEVAGDPPPATTLGVSSALRVGQPVIAVGAPLGLTSTVTAGIVSAVDRTAQLGPGSQPELPMVQTDASINPGNSGGPLANLRGQVVGMNTAIATVGGTESGNIGIGFAVPIDRAAAVARQIIEND
jgi:putative serine protease PepD